MSVLRSLESKLAGLVEGTFSRAFKSEVRPVEIARKLAREMDEHRVQSLSRMSTLDYLVQTHDRTARRLVRPQVRAFVQEDLAAGGTFVETLRRYVACDLNAKLAAMEAQWETSTLPAPWSAVAIIN